MSFIIVETHGGPQYAAVVTDPDGKVADYDDKELAKKEDDEYCQRGVVVEIPD